MLGEFSDKKEPTEITLPYDKLFQKDRVLKVHCADVTGEMEACEIEGSDFFKDGSSG